MAFGAYFLRLFIDYLTKNYADRIAKKIVEELKKQSEIGIMEDFEKQAREDVENFIKNADNLDKDIYEYIRKSK